MNMPTKRMRRGASAWLAGGILPVVVMLLPTPGIRAQEEEGRRDSPVPKKASPAEIERAIEALIGAGSTAERLRAERDLVDLGPVALEAVRRARKARGGGDGHDPDGPDRTGKKEKSIREALDRAAAQILAAKFLPTILERVQTGLYFDGQYDDFREEGPEVVPALLHIFEEEEVPDPLRRGAANALADLADATVLPRLRSLREDPLLSAELQEEAGILMAILGDTHHVDRKIAEILKYAGDRNPSVAVNANVQLAHLYYKIRKYVLATESYERILKIFDDLRKDETLTLNPRFFKDLALHHYNAACSYSLADRLEKARDNLRKAIELDPTHLKNMEKDGDLRKVREAPDHEEFLKKLKELLKSRSI